MKKNIGIFLAFSPLQSKSHGISRLLSFILSGILQNADTQVVIATPSWFKNDTVDFLQNQLIDTGRIELVATPKNTFLSHIIPFFMRIKTSSAPDPSGQNVLTSIKRNVFNFLITYRFVQVLRSPLGQIWHRLNNKTMKIYRKMRTYPGFRRIIKILFSPWDELKHSFFVRTLYNKLRTHELNKLIHMINSRPDISVWYIPALFWPEVKAINAKKVIAVPDIVSVDFPQFFSDKASLKTSWNVAKSISAGDHFVCYSEHVKQKHLVQSFAVNPGKISIIPHAHIDLSTLLVDNTSALTQHEKAIRILRDYQKSALHNHRYLSDYHIDDMRFIFYSSQIRPYKNFHHLIRAYEILLRERFVNVKLILTGDIKSDPELFQYILDKRLQYDVLSFHDISPNVLAALNHLAICVVNPSLFEGGFPFTFTEAYSVGTPSVMSAIPAVMADINDETLRQNMLFDPYNVEDMVNKMEWAIKNHTTLFELQAPLYESFRQRDWALVANEYTHLLTHFSKPSYAT